jgi:hypothetical protein
MWEPRDPFGAGNERRAAAQEGLVQAIKKPALVSTGARLKRRADCHAAT